MRTKIAGVETPVESCPVRLPQFPRHNCRKQENTAAKSKKNAVSCTSKRFNRAGCSTGNIIMKAEQRPAKWVAVCTASVLTGPTCDGQDGESDGEGGREGGRKKDD